MDRNLMLGEIPSKDVYSDVFIGLLGLSFHARPSLSVTFRGVAGERNQGQTATRKGQWARRAPPNISTPAAHSPFS